MDIKLLAFCVILVLVEAGEEAECPNAYVLYSKENMCISLYGEERSWFQAKKDCGLVDGKLVQIFDKDKESYIIEQFAAAQGNKPAWLGLNDVDLDGTFMYLNGSHLKTDEPGLGEWSGYQVPPPRHLRFKGVCINMMARAHGWRINSCYNKYVYYCEKPLMTVNETETPPMFETCTLQHCPCNKENWRRFEDKEMSYMINRVEKTFTEAAMICEKLGGLLVTVKDEETLNFLREMDGPWVPRGVYYWMGLFSKFNRWTWMDGKVLLKGEYQNWFISNVPGRTCAVTIWDYYGKWRGAYCNEEYYHVCQSSDPCGANAVLTINGVRREQDGVFNQTNDQEVMVMCDVKGYLQGVVEVNATCGGNDSFVIGTSNTTLEFPVHIDIKMHNQPCKCQLLFSDGRTKETRVFIHFKTRPRFAKEMTKMKRMSMKMGSGVLIQVHIYANPMPDYFEVMKDGNRMEQTAFNITLQPLDKPLYYTVNITLTGTFSKEMVGAYTLQIMNEINGTLEYKFKLEEASSSDPGSSTSFVLVVLITLIVATVLFVAFTLWRLIRKARVPYEVEKEVIKVGAEEKKPPDEKPVPDEETPPEPKKNQFVRFKSTTVY